jgi:hypothetical protein
MFEGWTAEIQVPTPEAEKGGLEWAGRRLPILDHRPGKGEAEFVLDLEDGQTLVVPESSVQVWNKAGVQQPTGRQGILPQYTGQIHPQQHHVA